MENNFKKTFLYTFIASLCINALIGIIVFISGNWDEIQIKILATTLFVSIFSLTSLCCSLLLTKKRLVQIAHTGIITSVLAFLYYTLLIWEVIDFDIFNDGMTGKFIFLLGSVVFAATHASLMLLVSSKDTAVNFTLSATLILNGFVLLLMNTIVFGEIESEPFLRIVGSLAILLALGTVVTPILNKVRSLK